MIRDVLDFFDAQRRIFGLCPRCGDIFRLSACEIQGGRRSTAHKRDWFDEINREMEKIEEASERLDLQENIIREKARAIGRKNAGAAIRKIDKLFRPRRMEPDEAKVIFHPVDYVVFRGMKNGGTRDLVCAHPGIHR
jgi:predicted Holliday junction resolvase-like endonuclease